MNIGWVRQQAQKIPYVKGNERVFSCVVNKNCKIIVVRISRTGRILDSWPCPSCMSLIKDVGFISTIECGIEER